VPRFSALNLQAPRSSNLAQFEGCLIIKWKAASAETTEKEVQMTVLYPSHRQSGHGACTAGKKHHKHSHPDNERGLVGNRTLDKKLKGQDEE
jgi:hypothetical protein